MPILADSTSQAFTYPAQETVRDAVCGREAPKLLLHPEVGSMRAIPVYDPEGQKTVAFASADPWLLETWQSIAKHRSLQKGWDGEGGHAPSDEALATAEALAVSLSTRPLSKAMQFAVDAEGRPSFAAYVDDFYLHLTISTDCHLSWYATRADREYFQDEVVFDRLFLPVELRDII